MTRLARSQKGAAASNGDLPFAGVAISFVLPCLNEEPSVQECVTSAWRALESMDVPFEVIVVDNGSEDRSASVARAAGARVISESSAGYGAASRAGLDAARGRILVLGDADGTYDFAVVPALVALLEREVDLVVGSRLRGRIEPGAMPWMHRWLGTPLLTTMVNILFGVGISDVNCGLRAITRSAYRRLRLTSIGMEFASEMVVEAAREGLRIADVPVSYRRRGAGVAKLHTWADGWRHLQLIIGAWRSARRLADRRVATAPVSAWRPDAPAAEHVDR